MTHSFPPADTWMDCSIIAIDYNGKRVPGTEIHSRKFKYKHLVENSSSVSFDFDYNEGWGWKYPNGVIHGYAVYDAVGNRIFWKKELIRCYPKDTIRFNLPRENEPAVKLDWVSEGETFPKTNVARSGGVWNRVKTRICND
jgi:hypothetical protein